MIFTTIGSAADYGSFGRWLLFILTVICWIAQFASMTLTSVFPPSYTLEHDLTNDLGPDRWGAAMALYMIGFTSYGATLVFYAAIFPRLARNTPHARELQEKYEAGEITKEEYELEESMEKNRISNISTVCSILCFLYIRSINTFYRLTVISDISRHCASISRFFSHSLITPRSTTTPSSCKFSASDKFRLLTLPVAARMRTGWYWGYGGVRCFLSMLALTLIYIHVQLSFNNHVLDHPFPKASITLLLAGSRFAHNSCA
jgi:hypothetical protein